MIMWGEKEPFHVWSVETEAEKEFARKEIIHLIAKTQAIANSKEAEWMASPEWASLKENELAVARIQRAAAKVLLQYSTI